MAAERKKYQRIYQRTEPIPPEEDSIRMTLRIPTAEYERLRAVASATKRPMTDIYRQALTNHLNDLMPPAGKRGSK